MRKKVFPGLFSAIVLLGLILGLELVAGWLLGKAAVALGPFFQSNWVLGCVSLVSIGLAIVLALGWGRMTEAPIPERSFQMISQELFRLPLLALSFSIACVIAGGTVVLQEVNNWLTFFLPIPEILFQTFLRVLDPAHPEATLFLLMLVAPFSEEFLFRGLLLNSFEVRYGAKSAIIATSLLFSFFHLNIWQAVAAFIAGLFLGWLRLRTRSLLLPIVAHSLFNGLPFLIALSGLTLKGYNSPLSRTVDFQDPLVVVVGIVLLGVGLALTGKALRKTDQ